MIPINKIVDFTKSIENTYTFDKEEYNSNSRWVILHHLYMKNVLWFPHIVKDTEEVQKIPKKIHQIWLGSPVPEKYKQWMDSWKLLNPTYEYRLWTDKDLTEDNIHITDWTVFNSIQNMGQKSDYLRYHILNQFGGLYADTDFECLKPFDELLYADFLTGLSYDKKPIVNIALLGSVPGHTILQKILSKMKVKLGDTSKNVFETTGPLFFTEMFFETVGRYMEGVVVLPPEYLYPFPNERGFQQRNGKDYIKDVSYAVHYWEVSWVKKRKK